MVAGSLWGGLRREHVHAIRRLVHQPAIKQFQQKASHVVWSLANSGRDVGWSVRTAVRKDVKDLLPFRCNALHWFPLLVSLFIIVYQYEQNYKEQT